jgi:hypothetical protein
MQVHSNVKEYIEAEFIHWVTGATSTPEIIDNINKFGYTLDRWNEQDITYQLYKAKIDWLKFPIDSEGATPSQDVQLDIIISNCAEIIQNLIKLKTQKK